MSFLQAVFSSCCTGKKSATAPNDQEPQRQPPSNPSQQPVPSFVSNITIQTSVDPSQIAYTDQPSSKDERRHYPYLCPICLRYFTHMLESLCCRNYLCVLCATDMQGLEARLQKPCGCPFGCSDSETTGKRRKFELTDVKLGVEVKKYSDSQCQSFHSNKLLASVGIQRQAEGMASTYLAQRASMLQLGSPIGQGFAASHPAAFHSQLPENEDEDDDLGRASMPQPGRMPAHVFQQRTDLSSIGVVNSGGKMTLNSEGFGQIAQAMGQTVLSGQQQMHQVSEQTEEFSLMPAIQQVAADQRV